MSTQLILYPQSFNGQVSSTFTPTPPTQDFLANAQQFFYVGSASLYNSADSNPPTAAIIANPPTIVSSFYRYTTLGGSPLWQDVTAPTVTNQNLVLSFNASGNGGRTGVYQQLSGLSASAQYTVEVNISAAVATGLLGIYIYNGSNVDTATNISTNTTLITYNFTSPSTNPTILFDYQDTGGTLTITSITIRAKQVGPLGVYTDLDSGQVICDLYQDQDIPLTLSIDDFKNAAEQVKSYSKSFDLPATKRNNKIFDNMYEVTRADDQIIFNPYRQTQCILKQDGFIIMQGYLRLINVKDKNGEISYNVNIFSNTIALADVLQNKSFNDLDFSELDHDYNINNINASFTGTLNLERPLPADTFAGTPLASTTAVLKYPFIDWDHAYLLGGTGSGNNATLGYPEYISLQQMFRPCIQLKYLIDRIFAESGFNYSSTFFDDAEFKKLFMDFNWGNDVAPGVRIYEDARGVATTNAVGTSYANMQLQSVAPTTLPSEWDSVNKRLRSTANDNHYQIYYNFKFAGVSGQTISVRWNHKDSSGNNIAFYNPIVHTVANTNTFFYIGTISPPIVMQVNETLSFEAKTSDGTGSTTLIDSIGMVRFLQLGGNITSDALLQSLRGELGQWEFLKGLMTMFNLVTLADENDPTVIKIETYNDLFINNTNGGNLNSLSLKDRSIQHDWTDKIDVSQMELKPLLKLKNKTIFKFAEDDEDYVFNQYKLATSGRLYGSATHLSGFNILTGTNEISAEPFAATVCKPLEEYYPNWVVPTLYAVNDEGQSEGFDNSPRIFYDNGVVSGVSYYVPAQSGLSSAQKEDFLQFTHLSVVPSTSANTDYVFESQQLFNGVGAPPINNLYNTYYAQYMDELYHPDTRSMTIKVNLTAGDIASFKFTDRVFIKNRVFRVNKIDYKPDSLAKVEFILIP